MPKFELDSAYQPDRRSAGGDRLAGRGDRLRRAVPDAARRHRHRQDDDDGRGRRASPEAGAGDRPQQDARRPAVQRVPDLLPAQRGRVLRLLLRLLPARGLRPQQGPVHREGLGDQPGDRPAAALGDGGAVRPPRRADRRERVVHLRPGLAADLRREPADAQQGRVHRSRRAAAQAGLDPVHAQRHRARPAGRSGSAARRSRSSPPTRRPPTGSCCSATRSSTCSTSTRSPAR